MHGRWRATEPDHRSDEIAWLREKEIKHPGRQQVVSKQDGDAWIVDGALEVLSLDTANDLVENYEKENYDPQGVIMP